ncbi:MAG: hypothetical protein WBC91_09800, partial [Phototrophicaceae bacterium]
EADWLSELGDDDSDDNFGFDDPIADDAQPAEADWLSELGDDDDDDFGFDEPTAEEQLAETEWLADLDNEEVGSDFSEDDEPPIDTDWSSDDDDALDDFTFDDDDDEFADFEDAPAAEVEPELEANWLESLDETDDADNWGVAKTGFTDQLDPSVVDEISKPVVTSFTDRLQDYDDDDQDSDEQEDDGNWLSDVGVTEEDESDFEEYQDDYDLNVSTKGMSEMLDSIRTTRDDDFEATLDDMGDFEDDEPEWLKATGEFIQPIDETDDEDADWFIEVDDAHDDEEMEEARPRAENAFELSEAKAAAERAEQSHFGEDTQQADADNAPDWLNAMVPGLDLDFEAEDEGHLDEGFDERTNTLRERGINESEIINSDFDWLQDIVEEETGMMEAVDVDDDHSTPPPPPIGMPQRQMFVFSSPPMWARGDAIDTIATVTTLPSDSMPDYLSDFDEFDDVDDDYTYDSALDDDNFRFDTDEVATQDDSNFVVADDAATTQNDVVDVIDETFDFNEGGIEIPDDFDDEFDGDFDELDTFDFDDDFDDFDDEFDD